ncbi:MAG: NfeD family protein [Dissulfuribacterales bacterium]
MNITMPLIVLSVASSGSLAHSWLAEIVDPNLAYILLLLGAAGLFGELAHPGSIFPGVFGAILLALGLYIAHMLSVTWTGLLLMSLAFLLFVLELFITSHGILGAGAVLSLLMGSFMLFDTENTGVAVARELVWIMVAAFSVFFIAMAWLAVTAQKARQQSGANALIGAKGVVKKRVTSDGGMVFVHGELWQAVSEEELDEGSKIRIKSVNGMTLEVEKAA